MVLSAGAPHCLETLPHVDTANTLDLRFSPTHSELPIGSGDPIQIGETGSPA